MSQLNALEDCPERTAARRWLTLSVGVLVLAGCFAVTLVVARVPPFDTWIGDPLFFRRALVVHVNLALVVWFYTFVAGLLFLLPGRGQSAAHTRQAIGVSLAGVGLMLLAPGVPGATPVLSNYIPMIDHPLFALGELLFAAGVLTSLLDRRLLPEGSDAISGFMELPAGARPGLRAAAIALLVAALTLFASWLGRPVTSDPKVFYELLFWGVGHVLQLASVLAMISVWLILLGGALRTQVVSRKHASSLFGLLLLPWLAAPVLAMSGTTSSLYREGFTSLMRWGIFPIVLVFLGLCLRALWREHRDHGAAELLSAPVVGFAASAALASLGFVLGALIREPNTMVPAHYHASIGAVTVAFMAGTYVLMPHFGLTLPRGWGRSLPAVQPALFAAGQAVFALGFGFAGAPRKVYGAEQAGRSFAQSVGLGVMGLGGLVAVIGGVLFLLIFVRAWWHRTATQAGAGPHPVPTRGGLHGVR